jgi:hypothetical protein
MVLAGYRGVIRTDQLQYWLLVGGACLLLVFSLYEVWLVDFSAIPPEMLSLRGLIVGPDVLYLAGSVVLVIVYQFCIMDMWQRAIAVAGASMDGEKALVRKIQRKVFRDSVGPFLLLFICWFAMGIAVLVSRIFL